MKFCKRVPPVANGVPTHAGPAIIPNSLLFFSRAVLCRIGLSPKSFLTLRLIVPGTRCAAAGHWGSRSGNLLQSQGVIQPPRTLYRGTTARSTTNDREGESDSSSSSSGFTWEVTQVLGSANGRSAAVRMEVWDAADQCLETHASYSSRRGLSTRKSQFCRSEGACRCIR